MTCEGHGDRVVVVVGHVHDGQHKAAPQIPVLLPVGFLEEGVIH